MTGLSRDANYQLAVTRIDKRSKFSSSFPLSEKAGWPTQLSVVTQAAFRELI
jgi:hypothetical protein